MKKTEKTINELSLELNMNLKLSNKFEKDEKLIQIKDREERPYGIENIGNSCYINSTLQLLASCKELEQFSLGKNDKVSEHLMKCEKLSQDCFDC